MIHIVGISEMKVTDRREDVIVTYSLGSCIGLTLWDPVAGMIHSMLPLSKIDPSKAAGKPCMFVDTCVPALLKEMFDRGAKRKNLVAKVAGCASLLDDKKLFKIGERNYTVLRKILWKNNILISAEDIGGTVSRTMVLYMADGRTTVKVGGRERELV